MKLFTKFFIAAGTTLTLLIEPTTVPAAHAASSRTIAHKVVTSGEHFMGPHSWQLAKVTCPQGYIATGGGIKGSENTGVDLGSSYPSSRSWIVEVNNWGPGSEDYWVTAVCWEGLGSFDVVEGSFSAAPDTDTQAAVTCPTGDAVLEGGVASAVNLYLGINSSIWAGSGGGGYYANEWAVTMSNASSTSGAFTIYAMCSAFLGNTSDLSNKVTINPGQAASLHVSCASDRSVIGGADYITYTINTAGAVIILSHPSNNGWNSDFYNGSNDTVTVQDDAICL